MTVAATMVLADEHLIRDEWVDEQARTAPWAGPVEICDETYRGVWRTCGPAGQWVHLFARDEDVDTLIKLGYARVQGVV
jgi:hypothetical protein